MGWDPNQGQQGSEQSGQDPHSQYGPPPQNPHQPPPYGAPPQNPYGYGTQIPPQQPPYGFPPPYGAPGYQPGYGYGPPPAMPLPLGQAISQLFSQYIRVLTKPGAATFAAEQGKAAWNIIWVQLLGLGVIFGIFGFLFSQLLLPSLLSNNNAPTSVIAIFETFSLGFAIASIVFTPLSYFITEGINYLIAKAFGGQGTFLAHMYCSLLVEIPLVLSVVLIAWIPFLGELVGIVIGIYRIVLHIFMIMGVHRLTGGKATLVLFVLFVPFIVLLILSYVFVAAIFFAIVAVSHPH